jgi:serine/threonine protein phosphatase 1
VNWFERQRGTGGVRATNRYSVTPGQTIYAIGDIHGRLDLLKPLLQKIYDDQCAAPEQDWQLVFLGDYIDRGPSSRDVVQLLLRLSEVIGKRAIFLKGNHESAMLDFLADPAIGQQWIEHGGRETLLSYGIDLPSILPEPNWQQTQANFQSALPAAHRRFFESLQLFHEVGDYIFVHAGLRPGVALDDQVERDLLWIREPFLSYNHPGPQIIVHGHTIETTPVETETRIGIDTGAYATGKLTALRLRGQDRVFFSSTNSELRPAL